MNYSIQRIVAGQGVGVISVGECRALVFCQHKKDKGGEEGRKRKVLRILLMFYYSIKIEGQIENKPH